MDTFFPYTTLLRSDAFGAVAEQDAPDQSQRLDRPQHPQNLEGPKQLGCLQPARRHAGQQVDPAPAHEAQLVVGFLQAHPEIDRSEEHTSELQSLMRLSYAVFCLKKKNTVHLN